MNRYSERLRILQESGLPAGADVCEYYFAHRRDLDPKLFGKNVSSDEFAMQVRWKSTFGIACVDALKQHFDAKMKAKEKETAAWFKHDHEKMMTDPSYRKTSGKAIDWYATIDLEDFDFEFNGRRWSLPEFTYSFKTGRISPQQDLIAIDLSGVRLHNVRLVNLCLANACFDGASLDQVELINTNFPQASFRNARIMTVRAQNRSFFNNADVRSAGVFGIHPLSDETLTAPLRFSEISYWTLLGQTITALFHTPSTAPGWKVGQHTTFMNNTVTGLTLPDTQSLREYVTWYQFTMERIRKLRDIPILSRIGFALAVLTTKHWTSYKALAGVALLVDVVFALTMWLGSGSLFSANSGFLDCLYSSTLLFTSIGIEGIKPISHVGQWIVMCEAVAGYVTLALFVFLIARKIEWDY